MNGEVNGLDEACEADEGLEGAVRDVLERMTV